MAEVREYMDARGRTPYRDWVSGLDAATSARIITAVLRMEGGNFSGAKSVGAEYRSCGWTLAPDTESISAEMGTS